MRLSLNMHGSSLGIYTACLYCVASGVTGKKEIKNIHIFICHIHISFLKTYSMIGSTSHRLQMNE